MGATFIHEASSLFASYCSSHPPSPPAAKSPDPRTLRRSRSPPPSPSGVRCPVPSRRPAASSRWPRWRCSRRSPGVLQRVNFSEGQDIRAGQVLFEIDPRPYRARLEGAQAALARDVAQLGTVRENARRLEELGPDYVTRQQIEQARGQRAPRSRPRYRRTAPPSPRRGSSSSTRRSGRRSPAARGACWSARATSSAPTREIRSS